MEPIPAGSKVIDRHAAGIPETTPIVCKVTVLHIAPGIDHVRASPGSFFPFRLRRQACLPPLAVGLRHVPIHKEYRISDIAAVVIVAAAGGGALLPDRLADLRFDTGPVEIIGHFVSIDVKCLQLHSVDWIFIQAAPVAPHEEGTGRYVGHRYTSGIHYVVREQSKRCFEDLCPCPGRGGAGG
jgi:hypothetical protein